jgi:hypothetical protein
MIYSPPLDLGGRAFINATVAKPVAVALIH